jgi:hypothetical protein
VILKREITRATSEEMKKELPSKWCLRRSLLVDHWQAPEIMSETP